LEARWVNRNAATSSVAKILDAIGDFLACILLDFIPVLLLVVSEVLFFLEVALTGSRISLFVGICARVVGCATLGKSCVQNTDEEETGKERENVFHEDTPKGNLFLPIRYTNISDKILTRALSVMLISKEKETSTTWSLYKRLLSSVESEDAC
jgi:hypothetical protein